MKKKTQLAGCQYYNNNNNNISSLIVKATKYIFYNRKAK